MKNRILPALLLAALALPLAARADDMPPNAQLQSKPAPGAKAGGDEQKTDLEVRMGKIGKAYRKLRKQIADPAQNASSLELIATIQAAAKEALQFNPAKEQDLPADQRAKFDEDFHAGINKLLDLFSSLKDAVAAGKNDEAAKIVADITALEKKDHEQFKRPDKD